MRAPLGQRTLSRRLFKKQLSRPGRRGVAAVEFAVVAPLFLLLLAGIIEFGQAFRIEHAISNACRRGARSAVVDGATSTAIINDLKAQCADNLGVNEADVTVVVEVNGDSSVDLSQSVEEDEISVTVSIPFSKAGIGFFAHTFSNSVLSSTCTLEHE